MLVSGRVFFFFFVCLFFFVWIFGDLKVPSSRGQLVFLSSLDWSGKGVHTTDDGIDDDGWCMILIFFTNFGDFTFKRCDLLCKSSWCLVLQMICQ